MEATFDKAKQFMHKAYLEGCKVTKTEPMYKDETAIGPLEIVIGLGVAIIGLYIVAIVVGSMDYAVQNGNILMTGQFNTTMDNMATNAATSFSLANIIPIALVGVGVLALVIGSLMGAGRQ